MAARDGKKKAIEGAKINVEVFLGHPTDRDGFGLKVKIGVENVEDDALIQAAHEASLQ